MQHLSMIYYYKFVVFDCDIHSNNNMSQHNGMDSITIWISVVGSGLRLKCDGTHAKTRFRLSAERTSPFKSAGASVQSTTGN